MRTKIHFHAGRRFPWSLCCALLAFGAPQRSFAADVPDDDEPPWLMSLGPVDPEPQHELWREGASTGSLWVSVQATFIRTDQGKNDFAALAMFGVPLERIGRPRDHAPRIAERPTLPAPPAVRPDEHTAAPTENAAPVAERKQVADTPLVTPTMARAAIAAAMEHARLDQTTSRLDRLAGRARASALLPELRVRVTRQLDDSQVLSPTEYDPDRVTATVKASLWLEARATFKLDKLVFADEEVALERMREERLEAGKKLRERVLDTLFAWQKAQRMRDDPASEPDAQLKASLDVVEAEVTLDVLTGGWFSRWKLARDRPGPT